MLIFKLALILGLGAGHFANATEHFGMPAMDQRQEEVIQGNLFSVKIIPGAKQTSFYVVGKEAAKLKIDDLKVQLILDPEGSAQSFQLERKQDAFIFNKKLVQDSRLEIQDANGKIEQLKIKAKP